MRKIDPWEAKTLYIFQGLSTHAIARIFGVTPSGVTLALHAIGVELRTHTSRRTCRICGAPAFKRLRKGHNRERILTGGLCREHELERKREVNKQVRARKRERAAVLRQ